VRPVRRRARRYGLVGSQIDCDPTPQSLARPRRRRGHRDGRSGEAWPFRRANANQIRRSRRKKKGLGVATPKPLNFFIVIGAPGRIRTHDPLVRSLVVTPNMLFLLTILPTAVHCFISVQDSSVLCKSLQSPFTGTSGASSTTYQAFARRRGTSEAVSIDPLQTSRWP
jgi:hypothetical protein